jgi:7-cyano-7-deazaguanine synthase
MKKALVVFSGGQDSTTCIGWAKNRFDYIESITYSYNQMHKIEIQSATKIADILDVKNTIFDISIFSALNDSALLSDNDLSVNGNHSTNTDLPASFVPNRNAIFFTIAHAFAQKNAIDNIVVGISQADYSGYPDCTKEFINSLESTLNMGSNANIKFHYPLIDVNKCDTFAMAKDEGVLDLVIKYSHTCYNGEHNTLHPWGYGCGECPSCILRKDGWAEYQK